MGSKKDDFPLEWLSGKPLPPSNYKKPASWLDGEKLEYKPDIPKTSTWVKVSGVTKYQSNFAAILGKHYGLPVESTHRATLRAEPTNKFDGDAVQVFVGTYLIGYVEKETTWRFRRAESAGIVKAGQLETTVQIVGDKDFTADNQIIYCAKVDLSPNKSLIAKNGPSASLNSVISKVVLVSFALVLALTVLKLFSA